MKVLVVDMTHGGSIIASGFSKILDCDVFAWDIYHTLTDEVKYEMGVQGIKLVDKDFYENFNDIKSSNTSNDNELIVVAPVHCKLPYPVDMTHHQAVDYLMRDRIPVPIIEVTGVKGKTSAVAMLKQIYQDQDPLVLSSLGVEVVKDGEDFTLQKDISITPASIITAWELVKNFHNQETKSTPIKKIETPGICIFESSLGGTGLADVGVITNIVEDYSIAQGSSSASEAKSQMFKSKIMVCDCESFQNIYSKSQDYPVSLYEQKINTYSISEKFDESNVKAFDINYGLHETTFQVEVTELKTVNEGLINCSFGVSTFSPGQYHLENTLAAITVALTMETSIKSITSGLKNFKGLPGRTFLRSIDTPHKNQKVMVFEEINPGINVTAVKKAVNMIRDYENPALVMGGSYGITCEEIDEGSLLEFLDKIKESICIILTGELGKSLWDKIGRESLYYSQIDQAVTMAREYGAKNILLIYRSNFTDLNRR